MVANVIECAIEFLTFVYIVKEIHLTPSLDEMTEAYTNQPHLNAAVVKLFKQSFCLGNEHMV